jgi:hypothetical protein
LPEFRHGRRLPPCCCCCCCLAARASAPGGGPLLGSRTGGGGGRFRGPESGAGVTVAAARAAAAGSARQPEGGPRQVTVTMGRICIMISQTSFIEISIEAGILRSGKGTIHASAGVPRRARVARLRQAVEFLAHWQSWPGYGSSVSSLRMKLSQWLIIAVRSVDYSLG